MTKRFIKVLGVSTLLAAAFSMSAFAAETITKVDFTCGVDADAATSAGITSPKFVLSDAGVNYELNSYEEASDTSTAFKTARTYTLTFTANDGYEFPSADAITVQGKGITAISSKKVNKDDPTTLTVKCKAYPYYTWEAPEWDKSDLSAKTVTFKRPAGATIEYLITYTNQNGDTKHVHSSTTSSSITISGYNKKLTEAQQKKVDSGDSELRDAEIVGIAIRAKGNAGENSRTAPSQWNTLGSIDIGDFDNINEYDSWGDIFEGVEDVQSVGGGSSSSSSRGPSGPTAGKLNGWNQGLGGVWYYYDNSVARKGWMNDGANWYYLDPTTGIMQTGWVIDGGKKYYCNPNAGGPQGAMVTGTYTIDGQTYTFDASGALQ